MPMRLLSASMGLVLALLLVAPSLLRVVAGRFAAPPAFLPRVFSTLAAWLLQVFLLRLVAARCAAPPA
eukprot:3266078-Prorocentrum_lima.AAC.1